MSEVSEYPPLKLAVAAIFRNEQPYIVEWLAFHRVVGVDTFYIADNCSDDGSTELLEALDQLNLIKSIPFPSVTGQPPQLPAYETLLSNFITDEEWVAVIDADEFIMPMSAPWDFKQILRQFHHQSDVGAIALNWAIYGSGWRENHSTGLVIERFDRRSNPSFGSNLHYKTILRRSAFDGLGSNPHHFNLKQDHCYVHANGQPLKVNTEHGEGLSQEVIWVGARLNHYIVKSKEEFVSRKQRNGSAASLTRIKDESYFQSHDRNDKRDPIPPGLLDKVRAEVARIQQALGELGYMIDEIEYPEPSYFAPFSQAHGVVDAVEIVGSDMHIRGWVFLPSGTSPSQLIVRCNGQSTLIDNSTLVSRPDVQRHYPMAQTRCGFHIKIPTPCDFDMADSVQVLAVGPNGALSEPLHRPKQLSSTV